MQIVGKPFRPVTMAALAPLSEPPRILGGDVFTTSDPVAVMPATKVPAPVLPIRIPSSVDLTGLPPTLTASADRTTFTATVTLPLARFSPPLDPRLLAQIDSVHIPRPWSDGSDLASFTADSTALRVTLPKASSRNWDLQAPVFFDLKDGTRVAVSMKYQRVRFDLSASVRADTAGSIQTARDEIAMLQTQRAQDVVALAHPTAPAEQREVDADVKQLDVFTAQLASLRAALAEALAANDRVFRANIYVSEAPTSLAPAAENLVKLAQTMTAAQARYAIAHQLLMTDDPKSPSATSDARDQESAKKEVAAAQAQFDRLEKSFLATTTAADRDAFYLASATTTDFADLLASYATAVKQRDNATAHYQSALTERQAAARQHIPELDANIAADEARIADLSTHLNDTDVREEPVR